MPSFGRVWIPTQTSATPEGWQRPLDWIPIDTVPSNALVFTCADITSSAIAFICTTSTGTYHVDWGDGTSYNYSSGATAEHAWTQGTGTVCSRGYTMFNVTVTPNTGNLPRFYVYKHSLTTLTQYFGILEFNIGNSTLTSMAAIFSNQTPYPSCPLLERVLCSGSTANVTNMSYAFSNCISLQSLPLLNTQNVTDISYCFYSCYAIKHLPLWNFQSVLNAFYCFGAWYALQSIPAFNLANVTNLSYMFNNCYSLRSVGVMNTIKATNMNSMFYNCYALADIPTLNVAGLTDAGYFCSNVRPLSKTVDLSAAVGLTKVGFGGCANMRGLLVSSSAPFSGSSPQIDVYGTAKSATALNSLFNSLPTLAGKAIRI